MVRGHSGDAKREAVLEARLAPATRARAEGDLAVFESLKATLREPPLPGGVPHTPELRERWGRVRSALRDLPEDELLRLAAGQWRNFAAMEGVDLTPRLGELRMPVCVIHGTADALLPFAAGEALAAAIPHAEFHVVEGGPHGILAHPEAAAVVREWVARVTGA